MIPKEQTATINYSAAILHKQIDVEGSSTALACIIIIIDLAISFTSVKFHCQVKDIQCHERHLP